MTTTGKTVRLRKVPTPAVLGQCVKATYAVLVDGEVEGHVDKYVERETTNHGGRHGRGQRHRMHTGWGWRRPGVREDATGYDRRRDAVDQLVKSLGAGVES